MRSFKLNIVVAIIMAAVLAFGCQSGDVSNDAIVQSYRDAFHFDVEPDAQTPDGISVDTNGTSVDLAGLDAQVAHIEACLLANFPDGSVKGLAHGSDCRTGDFDPHIDRSSFMVVVDPDFGHSCTTGEEVLSVDAPQEGCSAKGLAPDPNCPCRWRAGFQDEPSPTIVITPSARMFPDPLVRFVTGCMNTWVDERLTGCVRPTVQIPSAH